MLCGGNIDTTILGRCLERGLVADGRLAMFKVVLEDRPGSAFGLCQLLFELKCRSVHTPAIRPPTDLASWKAYHPMQLPVLAC